MEELVAKMSKYLTLDEFDTAKALYAEARNEGMPATRAAAVCYRAGRLAGIEETKQRTRESQRKAMERRAAREAAAAIPENGGNADE